jgi:hypothetical protein
LADQSGEIKLDESVYDQSGEIEFNEFINQSGEIEFNEFIDQSGNTTDTGVSGCTYGKELLGCVSRSLTPLQSLILI